MVECLIEVVQDFTTADEVLPWGGDIEFGGDQV